jgi:hypothetical protein
MTDSPRHEAALISDSLVWISGATYGLGAGFVRTCPYPDARIINLSRSEAAAVENVHLDLADIWDALPDGGPGESVLLFGAPPAGVGAV